MRRLLALATLALVAGAHAQPDFTAERARIRAERARIESAKAAEERACREKFAVNDCLADVRQRWREPLADLRRQELAIGDEERKRRSADQVRELESRQSPAVQQEQAERRAKALEDQRDREERAARKAGGPQPGGSPRAPREAASGPVIPADRARENARAHEDRVRQAREHKDDVLRRQADKTRKPASSLPVPP